MHGNHALNAFDRFLCALSPSSLILLSLGLVLAIGAADYLTGYDMSLASLYLLPVFVVAWPLGAHAAVVIAIICAVAWFMSILFMQPTNVPALLQFWDGLIQLVVFLLFGLLIARLKTALEQADERFVAVLEGLDAAIYVTDTATGELLYGNRRFNEDFPDPDSRPAVDAAREQIEFHDTRRDKWYLLECRSLRWIDGRPVRLQLAADISERKRAEALLRAQQDKIQSTARLAMAGELATTVAHELNQPLGAIRNYIVGCIRRLRAAAFGDSDVLQALMNAASQAERAADVIQRLRSMVGRRPAHTASCDINRVIRDACAVIESEAHEHDVALSLDLAPDMPAVRIDSILVEQVILNLARNAIDAMEETPREERKMQIRSHSAPDGTVVVEVSDRGPGIAAELQTNLFTPFFSTKAHGMGLGLHICRSIVEAHGGHISVQGGGERGTTFAFSLNPSYV